MTHSLAAHTTNPPTHVLFNSDLWEQALEKYANATHVTVKLFDTDLRVVFGPIHPTPLFELFDSGGYEPGLFAECARQCLLQTANRPTVTVSRAYGLAVFGTSLVLDRKVVGAAVAGYVLVDFSQLSEIQRVAKDARLDFAKVWEVARQQSPVSHQRLDVNGELLQVLGDAILRENARTRQYEQTALELQETGRAKENAYHELRQTASALRASEEQMEKELTITQQLQSASALLIEGGDSHKLYQGIVDAAAAIMRSDMASMQMLFPERGRGGELHLLAFHGFDPEAAKFWEWVSADSSSSCGAALRSGARVIVADVQTSDFMAGTEDQATYLRAGIHAVQSTPLRSRAGHPLGMISTHWRSPHTPAEHELRQFNVLARQAADLLEREQSQVTIRESEERYRTLFELGPIAIYSCDASGVICDYNHVAAELWGREPKPGDTDERWCGSFKMLRPDGVVMPHDQCPMAEVLSGKLSEVRDGEVLIERPDGSQVTVLVNISPVKNEQGEIAGAINCFVDITERKVNEKALQEAHDRLESIVEERTASVRRLSLKLLTVQDEEHRSIARELHDSVGQHLAGIKVTVDRLQQTESPKQQAEALSKLSESLDQCMTETRTISYLLHPPLIDELGFRAAAEWFIEGFSERSGIKVDLELSNEPQRLPRSIELPLFRILQASLSNVHRHAHSASVDVRFAIGANEVKLEVKDYGRGIDPEQLKRLNHNGTGTGIGLAGMRERLRELGGRLEVESDSKGTLIRAVIPISTSTDARKSESAA